MKTMWREKKDNAARGRRTFRTVLILALALLLAVSLSACGNSGNSNDSDAQDANNGTETANSGAETADSSAEAANGDSSGAVRVGSKDFTESQILGEIYALALEDKGGLAVEREFGIAGSTVHTALINDEIDLYPEYTGTGLLSVLQLDLITDPQQVYDKVKDEYKKQFDVVWLDYAQANDGQGLAVTKEASDTYGIETISDLQENAEDIRFISQGEFDEREDGLPGLEKVYGPFDWESSTIIDNALKYETLKNGEGDAIPAYTTEGNLVDPDFVLLEDDKQAWPPYNVAPVVRANVLEAHPDIESILNAVDAKIDTPTLTGLNAEVDVDGKEFEEVAKAFYDSIKDSI
jgi:osmoprotectant transport system substrate-binding protein